MSVKRYRYFTLGSTPVRVSYNERGLRMGAEKPDIHTGELKFANDLLMRLADSPDAEEIDAEQFEQLCRSLALPAARPAGR